MHVSSLSGTSSYSVFLENCTVFVAVLFFFKLDPALPVLKISKEEVLLTFELQFHRAVLYAMRYSES